MGSSLSRGDRDLTQVLRLSLAACEDRVWEAKAQQETATIVQRGRTDRTSMGREDVSTGRSEGI
jgi:hypothetical protein